MKQKLAALMLSLALFGFVLPSRADDELRGKKIKHVLLISVDGLHALDVANYVAAHPNSAMARLAGHGVTYSNARTPANSDSFPGLLALVTGGSPISHRLFYDVSYDRTIYAPSNTTCFVPGVMAYALSRRVAPKLNSWMWPVSLLGLLTVFLSHTSWQFSWLIALVVGLSVPFFVEQTNSFVNKQAHRIAKYSYGIYLGHTLCIWTAFSYLHFVPSWLQWLTFISLLIAIPYFYFITIEKPGIYAGKRISNWLTVPRVAPGR